MQSDLTGLQPPRGKTTDSGGCERPGYGIGRVQTHAPDTLNWGWDQRHRRRANPFNNSCSRWLRIDIRPHYKLPTFSWLPAEPPLERCSGDRTR